MTDFFDLKLPSIDGSEDLLGPLRGRVVLIVNVASRCGLTPQYRGLEQLWRELSAERFLIVGCPCNQFGAQEPGDEAEIRAFCATTFDVTFPMSAKIDVNGSRRSPVYAWLTDDSRGHSGDIEWNFEKFLISHDGRLLGRYAPAVRPDDKGLLMDIAAALEAC